MAFNIFLPNFTLFFLSGGLGLTRHPLVIHGRRVLQEINLVSINSIFTILNISSKEMGYWVSFVVFILKYWAAKVMPKKCFLVTETYKRLTVSKTSVMSVIVNFYFFARSSI